MLKSKGNHLFEGGLALTLIVGGAGYMFSSPRMKQQNCISYRTASAENKKMCGEEADKILRGVIRTEKKSRKAQTPKTVQGSAQYMLSGEQSLELCREKDVSGVPLGLICQIALLMTGDIQLKK